MSKMPAGDDHQAAIKNMRTWFIDSCRSEEDRRNNVDDQPDETSASWRDFGQSKRIYDHVERNLAASPECVVPGHRLLNLVVDSDQFQDFEFPIGRSASLPSAVSPTFFPISCVQWATWWR